MKVPPARIEAFLRRPDPGVCAVLFFGSDAGLVRERADALARVVGADPNDPFCVAELDAAALAADPARLFDEAAQISLMGGTRLVRVREGSDTLVSILVRYLSAPPEKAWVIIDGGELVGRSTLRRAFEDSPRGAAIGCYPDNARDLAAVIRDSLAPHGIAATRDAVDFLVQHLGNDRMVTRSELEKLALYVGDGGRAGLDDARATIAEAAPLALDDAVLAAAEGDAAALDRALAQVFQEGEPPVSVIRAALRHLQRLHQLVIRIGAGTPRDEAIRAARPPIFFKQQDSFRRQLGRWREPRLRRQLNALVDAETRMKTTGLPAETICRAALFDLARSAAGD
jgi:DNA polymerase-3 subunit delta